VIRIKEIFYLFKLCSIVLIFSIFINTSGYVFIFTISQKIIKKEIKQLLRKSLPDEQVEFLKIKIGDPNFRKVEKNEFVFNGRLYDIIEIRQKDGFMIIRCINDQKEEKLFKNLNDLIANNFNCEGARGNILNKLYSGLVFLVTAFSSLIFNDKLLSSLKIQNLLIKLSFFIEIPTPPPEFSRCKLLYL